MLLASNDEIMRNFEMDERKKAELRERFLVERERLLKLPRNSKYASDRMRVVEKVLQLLEQPSAGADIDELEDILGILSIE
mmetsp:Transcript_6405/g.9117  ORF Transcript_6405/g.9117 Transcript_6405/m.9117 type:complete len:81 (-) Transcript_6405:196-438(-)